MKLKYFLLLIITSTIIHQPSSIATVRYVSHSGTSTPPYTTWETAADSIQKCINYCVDGDTVIVANGTYYENLVITEDLYLLGSSMDSTIIDGTGLSDSTIFFDESSSVIKNFNVYGSGSGYAVAVRHFPIEIRDCKISNAGYGVASIGADIMAFDLIIKKVRKGLGLFGNGNNVISDCVILLDSTNAIGINIGLAPNGIYHITNNIILFTHYPLNSRSGISVGATRKVYIYNNLISGFTSENIFLGQIIDTAYINNNVLMYQDASGSAASIWTSGNIVVVKNVILSKNRRGIYQVGGGYVNSNYNIYWKNNIEDLYGLSYGDSDRVANPMFIKDTIPTVDLPTGQAGMNFDYHLQAYSPAIDAGDPDILDVDGTRSDIGMFGGPLGEKYTYMDLAPAPPANLTAVYNDNVIQLNWDRNSEADLSHYRIYRDTVKNFVYDTTKIIGETIDTTFNDVLPDPNKEKNYYYKITALDNQGNQSAASEEVHVIVTGLGEIPPIVVEEYKLMNNYPNPFNPSTTIPYRLKEAGYVKIMVYNILGELVTVLVNNWQNKGYHEVKFTPGEAERKKGEEGFPGMHTWQHSNYVSGIYLLRIEVIGEGNIPVFSDMRKMMLIK